MRSFELIGSGFFEGNPDSQEHTMETKDAIETLMMGYSDPNIMALSGETIQRIVSEAEEGIKRTASKVVLDDVKESIFEGAPKISKETVEIEGNGDISFCGEIDGCLSGRMTFTFDNILDDLRILSSKTKGMDVDLKIMVGAEDEESTNELVDELEQENMDNPIIKPNFVWFDRKSGSLIQGKNTNQVQYVATISNTPSIYKVEDGRVIKNDSPSPNQAGMSP